MSTFFSVFTLGFKRGPQGAEPTAQLDAGLLEKMPDESKRAFSNLLADFAREHLGMVVVPRNDARAQALALSGYKVTDKDAIRWDQPLFDTDGFEHSLVALGSREVVTKQSFTYSVWDRRTGSCLRADCADLRISNEPLDEVVRLQRREAAGSLLAGLHAEASLGRASRQQAPAAMYALCSSFEDGLKGSFEEGPFPEINPNWVDGDDFVFRISAGGARMAVPREEMLVMLGKGRGELPKSASRAERFSRSRP